MSRSEKTEIIEKPEIFGKCGMNFPTFTACHTEGKDKKNLEQYQTPVKGRTFCGFLESSGKRGAPLMIFPPINHVDAYYGYILAFNVNLAP